MIRVLAVDDEPLLLELTKTYLEKADDIEVGTAEDGEEALAALERDVYDVIVSDFDMPRMNGVELLKEVRKRGRMPFIVFTGKGREEVVIEALNHGADFYVQKGGEPAAQFAELEHMVRQAAQRARAEEIERILLSNPLEGIMILGFDGSVRYINSTILTMVGLGEEMIPQAQGMDILQFIDPESRAKVMKDLSIVADGGGGYLSSYSIHDLNGRARIVEGIGTSINFRGERCNLVFIRDVTEREQAVEALRRRDMVLESVRLFTDGIMASKEWNENVHALLSSLGRGTGVERAFILGRGPEEEVIHFRHEWTDEGVEGRMDDVRVRSIPFLQLGLGHWSALLGKGEVVDSRSEAGQGGRDVLTIMGAGEVLLVPIRVDPGHWGVLGFEDISGGREWSPSEKDALLTAAGMIGFGIRMGLDKAGQHDQDVFPMAER